MFFYILRSWLRYKTAQNIKSASSKYSLRNINMLILPRTEQSIVLTKMGSNLKKVDSCWELFFFFFYKKEFKYLLADLILCGNMEWELSLYQYALFLQQQVLITHERNYFKIISDNPSQKGFISSKPSVSWFLGVCVSLTATNGRRMWR